MKRQITFSFFDTEEAAHAFEKALPRHRRGSVTQWTSQDRKEQKYIAWYKI